MQFHISDLLDTLPEAEVSLQNRSDASPERIKELTMKKIKAEKKTPRRGMSGLGKILVAAAILVSLAVPALAAASGFHFVDWLEGLGRSDVREEKAHYASWEETEGFWQVSLWAKNLTREGMTLACREVQDSPVTGTLEIHGGYWLEHWNGKEFETMTALTEIPVEESREIRDGVSFETEVNWADAYGQLESGRYRLGKNFTYTYSDGKTVELTDWAEFRIFNEDMTPYINQCKDAMDALLAKEHSHISMVSYNYDGYGDAFTLSNTFTYEIRRSGENYLMIHDVRDQKDQTGGTWGDMLLGDKAYFIRSWNGVDVSSGAEVWMYDHLLSKELNQFDIWYFFFTMEEEKVGEIWVEDSKIVVLISLQGDDNGKVYKELNYYFDPQGNLIGGEIYYLPEPYCAQEDKRLSTIMTVHDTASDDIDAVIDAQNVGVPEEFSWEQEKQQYLAGTAGVKTSGFHNVTPVPITDGYDAFMHAFRDYEVLGETHSSSKVSYDPEADIWKVEYWWFNGDVHGIVYMDGQGVTQLTYMGPYDS